MHELAGWDQECATFAKVLFSTVYLLWSHLFPQVVGRELAGWAGGELGSRHICHPGATPRILIRDLPRNPCGRSPPLSYGILTKAPEEARKQFRETQLGGISGNF